MRDWDRKSYFSLLYGILMLDLKSRDDLVSIPVEYILVYLYEKRNMYIEINSMFSYRLHHILPIQQRMSLLNLWTCLAQFSGSNQPLKRNKANDSFYSAQQCIKNSKLTS